MYATHGVGDTLGGADGGGQESLTRSAFNRWVSTKREDVNQSQHIVYSSQ